MRRIWLYTADSGTEALRQVAGAAPGRKAWQVSRWRGSRVKGGGGRRVRCAKALWCVPRCPPAHRYMVWQAMPCARPSRPALPPGVVRQVAGRMVL